MKWTSSQIEYDDIGLKINSCSIVEYWEKDIQHILANSILQKSNISILEIGYGLGYASKAISLFGPKIHVLIEAHPLIADKAKNELSHKTKIIQGLWQESIKYFKNTSFNGIVFDAYPIEEGEFDGSKESTLRFVSPFLNQASSLLKIGGKLSFLDFSCSISTMSEFEQLALEKYGQYDILEVAINPPLTCNYTNESFGNVVVLTKIQ